MHNWELGISEPGGVCVLRPGARSPRARRLTVTRRTKNELIADSPHVLYEAQQLDNVVKGLIGIDTDPNAKVPQWMVNAFLEDVGLHARTLILFLYDKPRDRFPDEVLAVDYVPEWASIRPAESNFLKEVRERVGAEMAHITRRRATIAEEMRGWSYGKVQGEVGEVLAQFATLVPEDVVKPGWREAAWEAIPGFARVAAVGREHFDKPPAPPGSSPPPEPGPGGVLSIETLTSSREALQAATRATQGLKPEKLEKLDGDPE
jgi:hypothetical protein